MTSNVFVYGTLMFPEIRKMILKKDFQNTQAILSGFKRYGVAGENGMEAFPGIDAEAGSQVEGILLYDVDPESMKLLDRLEGSEYKRTPVHVSTEDKKEEASVYLWQGGQQRNLSGDWSPEEFKEKHLQYYLDTKIPMYLDMVEKGER